MKIENITSKDNQILRLMRRASRGDGNILIEGPKLINEALKGNFKLDTVAVTHETIDRYRQTINKCFNNGARLISISNRLMSGIGDAISSQGIVALSKPGLVHFENLSLEPKSIVVVCDGIQDPGNTGAIIRSAFAFNASAVILLPGTANAFSSKAIRGAAGACFRIPVVKSKISECIDFLSDHDVRVLALDAEGEILLSEIKEFNNCAIIIGNEGSGMSEEIKKAFPEKVRIQINPDMESLNTSISASIALYELNRDK